MGNDKRYPASIAEAIDYLLADLTLNAEIQITMMKKEDLLDLHFSFGSYIRNALGLWSGNEALMKSCRLLSGNDNLHEDDASLMIIQALWEMIQNQDNLELSRLVSIEK